MEIQDMQVSSFTALNGLTKQICELCGKKRMYFCYDCRRYMPGVEQLVPYDIKLPVDVDIIKHRGEKNSKSTAVHCLLLARPSTRLLIPPDLENYSLNDTDSLGTVLVYPSKDALSISEYTTKFGPINRLVFLDATWFQVGGLRMLPQIQNLPTVRLKSYKTMFWRPQKGYSDEHLATIEAIYYAVREVYDANAQTPYDGSFDDLLFWFLFFRSKVNAEVFDKNINGRTSSSDEERHTDER